MGNAPLHYLKNPPPELPPPEVASAHPRKNETRDASHCTTTSLSSNSTSSPPSPNSPDENDKNKKSCGGGGGGSGSFRFHHRHHGTGGGGSQRHSLRTFEGLVKRAAAASTSHHKSKQSKSKGAQGGGAAGGETPLSPRSRRRREHRLARARERVGRHLLHDCADVEEHLAKVEELCLRIRGLRGVEALREMGFEYRIVHGLNCDCEGVPRSRGEDVESSVSKAKKEEDDAPTATASTANGSTTKEVEPSTPSFSDGLQQQPPPMPSLQQHPMIASQPRSISMELREAMEHWNVRHSHDAPPSGVMSQLTSACASPLTVNDDEEGTGGGGGGEVEMTGSSSGGDESCSSSSSSGSGSPSSPRPDEAGEEGASSPDLTGGEASATTAIQAVVDEAGPAAHGRGTSVASVASSTCVGGIELTDNGDGNVNEEQRVSLTRCETAEVLLRGSSSGELDVEGLAVPLGDRSDHGLKGDDDGATGETSGPKGSKARANATAAAGGGDGGRGGGEEEKKDGDDALVGKGGDALLEGFGHHTPGHITRLEGQEDDDQNTKSRSEGQAPPASLREQLVQHTRYHFHTSPEDAEDCTIRLVHVESDTIITDDNRRLYVADGDMYESLTNAAQEYAQDLMVEEGDLEWITICDDKTQGEPIRALVDRRKPSADAPPSSSSTPADEKTLLIATGKGKVRAGIFSRKHLLTTGIEPSTALPLVQQARRRKMRIVIIDPNARGERSGMDTFEMSMEKIFVAKDEKEGCRPSSSTGDESGAIDDAAIGGGGSISTSSTYQISNNTNGLYILAHSASGAQLVRYFLDKQLHPTDGAAVATPEEATSRNPESGKIRSRAIVQTQQHHDGADSSSAAFRVEAIAFTDSTHNVQWTKKNPCLRRLLENDNSMYLRSAHQHDSKPEEWHRSQTGAPVDTDEHWKHRFGDVKTMWAGTKAHELINWTGRQQIWDHFDAKSGTNSGSDDGGSSEPSNDVEDTRKDDLPIVGK